MPQFVACKFRPDDQRSYTYVWDGEPLNVGDVVKVPDRSGDGWKRVHVASISNDAPPFECKPILGLAPEEDEPAPEPETAASALDGDDGLPF
ncbi:hypothetical protein [Sphingopyxis sp. 113P3]|uniref:hypothetical protein n=1 Tax=Sphingopyxis sp. (strain 113P3) TaxID=292913 RepID=UPI0006AD2AD7|nr:hypothetical protein [Sphingopyxis sp. 113P3]ALC12518.1 hypothetical protein LH20_11200 [Sphingopyxis sp. 113P3]